ncbi:MAG: VOC family protein [Anaerolineae bacterium]
MASLNPYLNFGGNCEEAFKFYRSVFGGEFLGLMRFKEMPGGEPLPDSEANKVMHVSLPIGPTTLMGSDRPAVMGPLVVGNNSHISINAESEAEATDLFNGLSAGGQVTMPLAKAFWGDLFGMCTDRFGVSWMISCEYPKE